MQRLVGIVVRLKALVFRSRVDADLDEEMRFHLDREIERNVANGMTSADAERAARRAFGNVSVATEHARDEMRWRWIEELRQDVAFGLRTFRRAPAFVAGVVGTIGLGLGLLTAAFTVFDAYVLRTVDVRDAWSLFDVFWYSRNARWHAMSWPQLERLRAQHDVVADAFGYVVHVARMRGAPVVGQLVTDNYFQMLGVPPALGRTLLPGDAAPPIGRPVMVLSHRTWTVSFGADSSVIGRTIRVSGVPVTIVGVARKGFGGLGSVPNDFWMPATMITPLAAGPDVFGATAPEELRVVARLATGVSEGRAASALTRWIVSETADRPELERARNAMLVSRATSMPRNPEVIALFAPIVVGFGLVMLVACANVANMMLARGLARQREIGVRLALGAGRARLIRQLVTESVLLALPAAAIGFVISRVALGVSIQTMMATVPPALVGYLRVMSLDADATLVVFMFAAAVGAAIAFGLAPALQSTRPNIVQASRGDFESQYRPSRLRNGLVVAQVATSVVLLISAGVLLGNARQTQRLDPGLRTADVLQLDVRDRWRSAVLERLAGDPDIRSIASSAWPPLDGGLWVISLRNQSGVVEGTNINLISPDYAATVGLRVVRGRTFSADEARSSAPIALVSEAAARRFWPNEDAIGQTIEQTSDHEGRAFAAFRRATVVGVVADVIPGSITRPATWPTVYYPKRIDTDGSSILVRVTGIADDVRLRLERELASVDSGAVNEIHSLATSFAVQVYPFRAAYWLATAVGCIALLLTLTGVYGVITYVVSQRRKEFGIRLALGAAEAGLIAMVLRESMRLSMLGVIIGAGVAAALSAVLSHSLLLRDAFNIGGYAAGILFVLTACVVAAYAPSRRAARANPVEALRADS